MLKERSEQPTPSNEIGRKGVPRAGGIIKKPPIEVKLRSECGEECLHRGLPSALL